MLDILQSFFVLSNAVFWPFSDLAKGLAPPQVPATFSRVARSPRLPFLASSLVDFSSIEHVSSPMTLPAFFLPIPPAETASHRLIEGWAPSRYSSLRDFPSNFFFLPAVVSYTTHSPEFFFFFSPSVDAIAVSKRSRFPLTMYRDMGSCCARDLLGRFQCSIRQNGAHPTRVLLG